MGDQPQQPIETPRRLYQAAQLRMAAAVLSQVAQSRVVLHGDEESARVLARAVRDAQRVARSLETDEPLLPE